MEPQWFADRLADQIIEALNLARTDLKLLDSDKLAIAVLKHLRAQGLVSDGVASRIAVRVRDRVQVEQLLQGPR